jgi:hypothetical protein
VAALPPLSVVVPGLLTVPLSPARQMIVLLRSQLTSLPHASAEIEPTVS